MSRGGILMLANAVQGRSLAENHDYCFADRTALQLPWMAPVDEGRAYPGQRGQSVYWSICMSMGWDCGSALDAAAALPQRGIPLRAKISTVEEV